MQLEHAAPPVPHADWFWTERGTQVLPSQQPLGQLCALQVALVVQTWLAEQVPPFGQVATQVFPLQHPVGQEFALHWLTALSQSPSRH